MKILQPHIFQEWVSLETHINNLSTPEREVSVLELVNLVVKFSTHYILSWIWESIPERKLKEVHVENMISEATLCLVFNFKRILTSILYSDMRLVKEIDDLSKEVWYQLKMLLDLPKTVAVMHEIISQKIPNYSDTYNGLDLWTGSWILLLGQYIQARRNWFKENKIKNIGIEYHQPAVSLWNTISEKLGFWEIIWGDTRDVKTIHRTWFQHINYISNENLPYPKVALFTEPFVENLQSLIKAWFIFWEIEGFFPQVLYYSRQNSEGKKLNLKIQSSWDNFLDDFEEFEKQIKISSIQIWWTKTQLSEIWTNLESQFFHKAFLSFVAKRW